MSLKDKKEQEKQLKAQLRQKDSERKEELINIIINYPAIWNKSSSDFRDRQLQGVQWEEIAKTMKMSIKDTKNMWKYLKDQFRTNFFAVSKKTSGQEYVEEQDIKLVKWPFFKQLMFLKDVVSRRDTFSNLEINEDDGETAQNILNEIGEASVPDILEEPEDHLDDDTQSESHLGQQNVTTQKNKEKTRASTAKPATNKKRKQIEANETAGDEHIQEEINKIDQFLAASIAHKCEQNVETRSQRFCKYLADLLSQVPEESQLDCEYELMGVVHGYLKKRQT